MVNFDDIVVNDIVDYKTEEELCHDYLQYIDLDSTIKNTFPLVIDNLVRECNLEIITDMYLDNTDTYVVTPIYRATARQKYMQVADKENIKKYEKDYELHKILINHNLVNCLIELFNSVGGCTAERIPPVYSKENGIVYDKMERVVLTVPRKNYYPKKVVELYNQDSKAAIVKEKMLREKLKSLDLGIADITPYLKISYPKEYVLDDISINPDILLEVSDYKIAQKTKTENK